EASLWQSAALEQSIDGIVVTDPDGDIRFVNNSFAVMHGYSPEGLVGRHFSVLHTEGQFEREVLPYTRKVKKVGGYSDEIGHVTKAGSIFPTRMSSCVYKNAAGEIAGVISVVRDVTDRVQVDETLRQARKAAKTASRAKKEFLANMSHEIRTPMNGIMGMAELLMNSDLDNAQRMYAKMVMDSSQSLLRLINDILDLSRLESGKLDLKPIDFNLSLALEEAIDVQALRAEEKGLEFVFMIDPDTPDLLHGDPARLRQVVSNITGNAIKFTSEGEVNVRGGLEVEKADKVVLRFTITDTGIGIPRDRRDALFDAFTQADASATREFGGVGLGLPISKQLVEMMGGRIGFESSEGRGSTFWFTVALGKQPPMKKPERSSLARSVKEFRKERILIVDDNETNRRWLAVMLDNWKWPHDEAYDAEIALEKLREAAAEKNPFRVALVDMQMPGMDGATLGVRIKKDPDLKDVILVMLTSLGMRGDAERTRKIGFSAYLTKPVKQSILHDCLIKVLDRSGRSSEGAEAPIVTRHTIAEEIRENARILLVEDNIVSQKAALGILTKIGFSADAVNNGVEALKVLESTRYDIILMDCKMPEMDGYTAAGKIRKMDSLNRNAPVIAMTAYGVEGERDKCIAAGMDDYIAKPVNTRTLSDMISKWLARSTT
ncbi:MAG: response regulator, partial [Desulfobacterales bacterium]|nr:response regulator [Desulfobacterales bacterium]